MKKEKIAYLQWLRVAAAFAVVLMHTAALRWYSVSHESRQWLVLTAWDSLVRWPVPVFIMITGAIFLPRKTSLRSVLTRYIPRMVLAWLVWSGLHTLYAFRGGGSAGEILQKFLAGHYHLWYLPFLCGVYLTLPFVQKIAQDPKLTKGLLVLSGVIGLLIPWLADAAALLRPEWAGYVRTIENQLNFSFFFDHLSILLLGHVLHQTDLGKRARRVLYGAGLLGAAVTIFGTVWAAHHTGVKSSLFFEHAAPNTLCMAAAIFVFAKYNLHRLPKAVDWMARHSFGVYLCHALILDILADRGIHTLIWDPVWSVPALSVAVFALSLAASAAIAKVPVIGKYLT